MPQLDRARPPVATEIRAQRMASRERIGIVSARQPALPPSQTCASECEDVLSAMLSAPIIPVLQGDRADGTREGYDRLIYVALNYWQLSRMLEASAPLRRRSGSAQAYVFDSFHSYLERWVDRVPPPLRRPARRLRHELRNVGALDRIFIPTEALVEAQQAFLEVPVTYLPIGVDAVAFGSERVDRSIDVNGYGRQPPALTRHLSDVMNIHDGPHRFHHTDHVQIGLVTDPVRHRRQFWRTLADSRVALAYAPEAYDPAKRFDCSFVGQRWYESLAAGCVIMGQAPSSEDAARLFDWPDALIELPGEPADAWRAIRDLLDDPARIARLSRRNYRKALARHDWRHRFAAMADLLGIERDAAFTAELARARPTEGDLPCAA